LSVRGAVFRGLKAGAVEIGPVVAARSLGAVPGRQAPPCL
jgi:hypothetical protein